MKDEWRMKDEAANMTVRRRKYSSLPRRCIFHLHPSAIILHPSSFIPHPSSFPSSQLVDLLRECFNRVLLDYQG
jgi:hypothetical protein